MAAFLLDWDTESSAFQENPNPMLSDYKQEGPN